MRQRIHRVLKALPVAIILAAALGLPGPASATHEVPWYWHWGYNYVGAGVNPVVNSGYNYWDDQYLYVSSRANGGDGRTALEWTKTNGAYCVGFVDGVGGLYRQTPDCGYGGDYVNNRVSHVFGNTAYLFVDSYNF
jgi:hypothetical protein